MLAQMLTALLITSTLAGAPQLPEQRVLRAPQPQATELVPKPVNTVALLPRRTHLHSLAFTFRHLIAKVFTLTTPQPTLDIKSKEPLDTI